MIKLIVFDLDGVLIEAKDIHFDALNLALGPEYEISWEDHISKFDGLKTSQKLLMLSELKGLPVESHSKIWQLKQEFTFEQLKLIQKSEKLIKCFESLVNRGFKLAVCSNSIRKTILTVVARLGIIEYLDLIISNEDVINSKPHPEMYWKAMSSFKVLPEETMIVEDSPYGLLAASRSKAHVLRVKNPSEVTISNIDEMLSKVQSMKYRGTQPKWVDPKLNVIIPMAGAGSRFQKVGYTFPKPLIDIKGKPMIQLVVENLNIDANFIYIVQKSHREKYNLDTLLNLITPNCHVIEVEGITEGAACTALYAKNLINNDNPLFFANSDQFVNWDSNDFFYKMNESDVDGGVPFFRSTHPKWSFAKLGNDGFISEVQEKNPISDLATVGFYYWKRGTDFVKYAEKMISSNSRVNGEFYVCPVYNFAIADGFKVLPYEVNEMWGLGTPEDLDKYIKHYH